MVSEIGYHTKVSPIADHNAATSQIPDMLVDDSREVTPLRYSFTLQV